MAMAMAMATRRASRPSERRRAAARSRSFATRRPTSVRRDPAAVAVQLVSRSPPPRAGARDSSLAAAVGRALLRSPSPSMVPGPRRGSAGATAATPCAPCGRLRSRRLRRPFGKPNIDKKSCQIDSASTPTPVPPTDIPTRTMFGVGPAARKPRVQWGCTIGDERRGRARKPRGAVGLHSPRGPARKPRGGRSRPCSRAAARDAATCILTSRTC